jgi:transposase-like protein
MVEQDHRGVKLRIKPLLGFKVFDRAAVTIAGVELLHRIRKGQFNLGRLRAGGPSRARDLERSAFSLIDATHAG